MAKFKANPIFCTIFHILSAFALSTLSAPQSAFVTQIPGFSGSLPSKHYSGYVTLDEKNEKKLFYYFVESERNPSEDPVVLWLNGGPGCSSFHGFVFEHGPFKFELANASGSLPKLHLNPYSWSKVSNILYLDSPVGVGLSYSKNTSDYITGDVKTAWDSHEFLLKWFELHPEFLSNPFYISGESYAGVYVPTLSFEVMKGIDAGTKPILNFKGYLIGNGLTDIHFDFNSVVIFAHGMGLISDDLYEETKTACKGKFYEPDSDLCESKLAKVHKNIEALNKYDILEPCYHDKERSTNTGTILKLPSRKREGIVPTWRELLEKRDHSCIDDRTATAWLNNASVRKAIHADDVSEAGEWILCTERILYTQDTGSMIKYHKILTAKGYRALIYSGDHDMAIPYTGTEAWIRSMGYKIIDEWRPWFFRGQVAGYTQGYEKNLTFLTIKGAGHFVPGFKPREALEFYSRFIAGKSI